MIGHLLSIPTILSLKSQLIYYSYSLEYGIHKAVVKSVPLQRLGSTDEIANACLFLASDYTSYISGTIIPLDGGRAQGAGRNSIDGCEFGGNIKREIERCFAECPCVLGD